MRFIEADLQQAAALWNSHRIRPSRGTVCPVRIPDELFFSPSNSGAEDYGISMNVAALKDMQPDACRPAPNCDSDDIAQYLSYVANRRTIRSATDGWRLYGTLLKTAGYQSRNVIGQAYIPYITISPRIQPLLAGLWVYRSAACPASTTTRTRHPYGPSHWLVRGDVLLINRIPMPHQGAFE